MTAPIRADARMPRFASSPLLVLLACLAALLVLTVALVPWDSYPVGFDVFRSLLIARTWAEQGFPATLPQAAFTGLDQHFADQQLALDGLLALLGGKDLGTGLVPPVLWLLFVLQGVAIWLGLRLVKPGQTPAWVILLPAISQAWLFRNTTLRALMLGNPCLVLLLAVCAARARGSATRPWWLLLCTAGFCYAHGAVELPPLLWLLGAVGTWLERGRRSFPWRDGLWVLGGLLLAALLRPDFPHNLQLWRVLNLGLLEAKGSGAVRVLPTELLPLSLGDLLRTEWTFLLAVAALALHGLLTKERRWSLLLPAALLVLAALTSRRLLELATPTLLLTLAATLPWRPRLWQAALLATIGCAAHVPLALEGGEDNRVPELQGVAQWLQGRSKPGDLVFVTDWGASSPLAFYTMGSGLRFSGMIDPVYMWAAEPELWQQWQAIKEAQVDDPIAVMRERFGARFLVFNIADSVPDQPPGTTANKIRSAMAVARKQGQIVAVFASYPDQPTNPRNWIAVELAAK